MLEKLKKELGPEHPHTLVSARNLDAVLKSQCKYDEAEAVHQRGPEHSDRLVSTRNFEGVFKSQGKYVEVEVMN